MKRNLVVIFLVCVGYWKVDGAPFSEVDNSVSDDYEDDYVIDLSHMGDSIFGEPDEAVGKLLDEWTPGQVNPEELGTYGEGDILMPLSFQGRSGISAQSSRWKGGIIPYKITGSFNSQQMRTLDNAFAQYRSKTCVRFVKRTTEYDYINIQNAPTGCWSSVGKTGGEQVVNLQTPGCITTLGTPIHELLHAAGFLHEQNRNDRDRFVSIVWKNIPKDVKGNFDKARSGTTNTFNVPYDYNSVMHYSASAFSTSQQPTIIALQAGATNMGQRSGFSPKDIQKINRMYGCQDSGGGGETDTGTVPIIPGKPTPGGGGGIGSGMKPIAGIAGHIISGFGSLLGALG